MYAYSIPINTNNRNACIKYIGIVLHYSYIESLNLKS